MSEQLPTMIRDATESDLEQVLRLNLESERFLSPLDRVRLQHLHRQAAYHRLAIIDGAVAAFLLVLREGADYDSPNYQWFAGRYPAFLYIDRVVVDARWQGRQLGAALYRDLFEFARTSGVSSVTCEFDVIPPNPASSAFHARFGFHEVGEQWIAQGRKKVSLQEARVAAQ
jgi:predicted GNAT superfamily acetyltransferase